MRFKPGQILDTDAEQARADAIERSEQSRTLREAANKKPPARPADWKAWRRPSDEEVNNEMKSKTKKE